MSNDVYDDLTTLAKSAPLTWGVAAQDRLIPFADFGAEVPFEDVVKGGARRVFDFDNPENEQGTIDAGIATVDEPLNVGEYRIRRGYGVEAFADLLQLRQCMKADSRDLRKYLRNPANWAGVLTHIDQLLVGEQRPATRALRDGEGAVAGYVQIDTVRVWSFDH